MRKFKELIEKYVFEIQEKKGREVSVAAWLDFITNKKSTPLIEMATHIAKFSNGDAKAVNIHASFEGDEKLIPYLSTGSLENRSIDLACNAADLPIGKFFCLSAEGVSLCSLIEQGKWEFLKDFSNDQEQLERWGTSLQKMLRKQPPKSHTYCKQVYFPVGRDEYHLLSPLFPSSLVHEIFNRIEDERYSEEAKEARKCRKEQKFHRRADRFFPNLAIQQFGGSKPQNISHLNSMRKGRSYLLRSLPPVWQSLVSPPNSDGQFWKIVEYRTRRSVEEYSAFCIAAKDFNTKSLREASKGYREAIIDLTIQILFEIRSVKGGWSKEKKQISHPMRLVLDSSEEFEEERNKLEWCEKVAKDFAFHLKKWLEKKLEAKKIYLGDGEYEEIKSKFLHELKEVEW